MSATSKSVQQLAQRAVSAGIDEALDAGFYSEFVGKILGSQSFDALERAVLAGYPQDVRNAIKADDEQEGRLGAIKAALGSDALRRTLFEVMEANDQRANVRSEANYWIGLEVGRRLAGGLR